MGSVGSCNQSCVTCRTREEMRELSAGEEDQSPKNSDWVLFCQVLLSHTGLGHFGNYSSLGQEMQQPRVSVNHGLPYTTMRTARTPSTPGKRERHEP